MPLMLLAGTPPLLAADDDGRPSRRSSSRGLKALSEETLRYYLGIAPGQPLDEETP